MTGIFPPTFPDDHIRFFVDRLKIPVIGNGDVTTPEDVKAMFETGCDGVMIGRGALGNPWMLYRTVEYLRTGKLVGEPNAAEKMRIAILHMDRLIALRGEHIAVKEMRKHIAWYLKGLQGAARIKDVVMEETKRDEMVRILEDFVSSRHISGAETEITA